MLNQNKRTQFCDKVMSLVSISDKFEFLIRECGGKARQISKMPNDYGNIFLYMVTLDKKSAEELYSITQNPKNRHVSLKGCAKYIHSMNSGLWDSQSTDAISMTPDMYLSNGHHRIFSVMN